MSYTGVRVLEAPEQVIADLYQYKQVDFWDKRLRLEDNQNLYVILKLKLEESGSTVAQVKGNKLVLFQPPTKVSNIKPINREQSMALDMLTDPSIEVVGLTGVAGSGKTLLALAAGMQAVEKGEYEGIILIRPMTEVGKYKLGTLPGGIEEKFGPYLENYRCNIEQIIKGGHLRRSARLDLMQATMETYNMDMVPIQLIRGASWPKKFIIADEVQTLDCSTMLTLGTRPGEGSKIVIMGDLDQRDEKITKDKTGIHELLNNPKARMRKNIACLKLIKCVRSDIARAFIEIFNDTITNNR